MQTVFLKSLPPAGRAPFAAKVTILQIFDVPRPGFAKHYSSDVSYQGLARVDAVIRGTLKSETVRVVIQPSDCDVPFRAGESGIVAGKVKALDDGSFELTAESGPVRF